jgi:hypothetical protein
MTTTIWVFAIIGMITVGLILGVTLLGLVLIGLAALGNRRSPDDHTYTSYNTRLRP